MRAEILQDVDVNRVDDLKPSREIPETDEDEFILAYNFDVIDDSPSEWFGIVSTSDKGGDDGNGKKPDIPPGRVKRIHNKADKRKKRGGSGAAGKSNRVDKRSTRTYASLSERIRRGSTSNSTVPDNWDTGWTQLQQNEWSKIDSNGNELGWKVTWKSDPSSNVEGVNTFLTSLPYNKGAHAWHTNWSKIIYDFENSNVEVGPDGYGPGNSVGSNATSFTLEASTNDVVTVGLAQTMTESNIDTDVSLDIYQGNAYVKHKYDISGDLNSQDVTVSSATVGEVERSSGETFVNIDLKAQFDSYGFYNKVQNGYHYYWE